MAKGGKVQHWKHGWIPLTPEARAFAAGTGPRPVRTDVRPSADALKRSKARQAAWQATQEEAGASVHTKFASGSRFTKVDGCPDISFKEAQNLPARSPQEYREVAEAAQAVVAEYPRAVNDAIGANRVSIRFSDELDPDVMADVGMGPDGDQIRLNVGMWDKPEQTKELLADMRERSWGIFALAPDLPTFRRYVLTHEIGHVLHSRDVKANRYRSLIDAFANEPMTPSQAGYQAAATASLDTEVPRWQLDNLGGRSAYAMANKAEFFAEAFLDGTINGDKASESGKRAVALTRQIFGTEGAA